MHPMHGPLIMELLACRPWGWRDDRPRVPSHGDGLVPVLVAVAVVVRQAGPGLVADAANCGDKARQR